MFAKSNVPARHCYIRGVEYTQSAALNVSEFLAPTCNLRHWMSPNCQRPHAIRTILMSPTFLGPHRAEAKPQVPLSLSVNDDTKFAFELIKRMFA